MSGGQRVEPIQGARCASAFCATCGEDTPHERVGGDGIVAKVCIQCVWTSLFQLKLNGIAARGIDAAPVDGARAHGLRIN